MRASLNIAQKRVESRVSPNQQGGRQAPVFEPDRRAPVTAGVNLARKPCGDERGEQQRRFDHQARARYADEPVEKEQADEKEQVG